LRSERVAGSPAEAGTTNVRAYEAVCRLRTIIFHAGGIGDFLLTCPSIFRLAEEGPLELLGRIDRLELAASRVSAIHDMERVDFESVFAEPSPKLRAFLAGFDRVIVWMRDDGTLMRAIQSCGVADVRVFPGLPPPDWSEHASLYYLRCLGIDDAPPLRIAFEPSATPHDVIIHPGSGSIRKNWPIKEFATLARELESHGRSVTWSLGPAEERMRVPDAAIVIRPDAPVMMARELAAARLYIGNDSGITHLAAAIGCATVAVFGPTDPKVWAPLGPSVTIIQGKPWPPRGLVFAAALES